ncbi:alpha/beta fold hydrolase [Pseudonocardia alni]|uniref:alpha/beta fold hydrolase n=1 Tax=Pseudonocardia alni TaxID=33907 RepID=UPI00340323ED
MTSRTAVRSVPATVAPDPAVGPGRTGTVRVDGADVAYLDSGTEVDGRPPMLLVHGTGGSTARHFGFLFPMLASAQRVVSVELHTPDVDPADLVAALARQVVAVAEDAVGDTPVTLVGYSLGAVVAATVAAGHPGTVGALALLAGWWRTDAQQTLRNDTWHALLGSPERLGRYQAFCAYSAPHLNQRTPAELAAIVGDVARDEATVRQMAANRTVDLSGVAPRIGCPTLVVAGTDDVMTPRRQAKRLFGAIPDARYAEVTSGHAMVAERPAELLHLLTEFHTDPRALPAGTVVPRPLP